MKCQVMHLQGVVALQGQLLAGPRRVMGGTRGMLRGGAMVDLWLPRVRGGCRCVRSGVEMHANPGTLTKCNRTARSRGEAKSWPDRPNGIIGPVSPGLHPGLVELALQAEIAGFA
jgi:hypothetical protein